MNNISNVPLKTLYQNLLSAIDNQEQTMINLYAKEITDRLYIPFNQEQTYEEMLISFGYKEVKVLRKEK